MLEVNVLGVHLCCRAVIRGCSSAAAAGSSSPAAARPTFPARQDGVLGEQGRGLPLRRDARRRARGRIPVFFFSPGLVQTEMTRSFGDDAPWTPPELAPQLVRVLASGRADPLSGPLPPRRARRHRGPDLAARRDRRERPERDPAAALAYRRVQVVARAERLGPSSPSVRSPAGTEPSGSAVPAERPLPPTTQRSPTSGSSSIALRTAEKRLAAVGSRPRSRRDSRAPPRRCRVDLGRRPGTPTSPSAERPREDAKPSPASRSGPQTKQVGNACSSKPG